MFDTSESTLWKGPAFSLGKKYRITNKWVEQEKWDKVMILDLPQSWMKRRGDVNRLLKNKKNKVWINFTHAEKELDFLLGAGKESE